MLYNVKGTRKIAGTSNASERYRLNVSDGVHASSCKYAFYNYLVAIIIKK